MKLFYAPGSCSLAAHIVLEESGLPYEAVRVDLKSRRTADDQTFETINAKGYVPCVLHDGQLLCENAALLPYLGELAPSSGLIPGQGTLENFRIREWVAYVCVELHKNCSPLFRPATPEVVREQQREILGRRFQYMDQHLGAGPYLGGQDFTVADAYLFVVLSWFPRWSADRAAYRNLDGFYQGVRARPAVQRAIANEGLTI
jgi:glutathione S-transferase